MVTTKEKVQQYLEEINKNDQQGAKINAFLELNKNALRDAESIDKKIAEGRAGKLAGKIIGIKCVINVEGMYASCASKTLEHYRSTYDATVIKKIKKEDGLILGLLNCDEFASGSSGETSAFGVTNNPVAPGIVAGGSSSGSAAAVAANFCDMALGTDTGCSIRTPASNCAVVGLKPTYASVSRYGLMDLSMSLDQIAPISKTVEETALLLDVIKGEDKRDASSLPSEPLNLKKVGEIPKKIIIGVPKIKIKDKKIEDLIQNQIKKAKKTYGWETRHIEIKEMDLAIEIYYPLVYIEFFSATRKYDGRRFGKKIEESCGSEVLRRIIGGAEITKGEYEGRYYHKALQAKKRIAEEFKKAFKKVDCIIIPTVPKIPHRIGEKITTEEMYAYDLLTIPANLAGNCAISLPAGKIKGVPIGLQIICDRFQEQKLLQIASGFEKLA